LAFGNVYASLRLKPKRIMVAWEVYQFRYFGEEVLCGFGSLNGVGLEKRNGATVLGRRANSNVVTVLTPATT
jgi:hypothetical protein